MNEDARVPDSSPALHERCTSSSIRLLVASDIRMVRRGVDAFSTHSAGGYETFEPLVRVFHSVELIARLAERGHASADPTTKEGITHTAVPDYNSWSGLARALPRTVIIVWRSVKDVEMTMGRIPEPLSIIVAIISRIRRKPFVANLVADPSLLLTGSGTVTKLLSEMLVIASRSVIRHAAATIYVTTKHLQSVCPPPLGQPTLCRSNVRIPLEDFRPPREKAPDCPVNLLLIGSNQSLQKGQDTLLDACAALITDRVPVRLTLVGGGRYCAWLSDRAEHLGIAAHVTIRGHVQDRGELQGLIDDADIFCLPSRSEGLPRAMVEVMARGVPAVGSTVGGIPELLPQAQLHDPNSPEQLVAVIHHLLNAETYVDASTAAVVRAAEVVHSADSRLLVEFFDNLLKDYRTEVHVDL